tara:strand:- start:650 stop:1312 length:663 start_codon:yes stop_codon:yes gene_type:complete
MHSSVNNLNIINDQINEELKKFDITNKIPNIIAVSKTFPIEKIKPLIESNHIHYGENRVQEAISKWSKIKSQNKNIKLHLVGKLQTNKTKQAIELFDYIHSLDNIKLAKKISEEQKKIKKKPKLFIQINIGDEAQKSGIKKKEIVEFYNLCKELSLEVIGTMCLPPLHGDTDNYFFEMKKLNEKINLNDLSMGMSDDYLLAIKHSATFLRIGTKIFGERV